MEIEPLVTVFCPTYNHKEYIRQCLESFVMQKTNFQIEVIIQDDASNDGTSEIILEYSKKYPFMIPVIFEKNIYSQSKNLNEYLYQNARGKYIAMCEGDDYWTDPYKLQKQFDFLENNKEYSGCFHGVYSKNEEIGKLSFKKNKFTNKFDFNFEDLISINHITNCSNFFRSEIIKSNKNWLNFSHFTDDFLVLMIAKAGKIRYIEQNMAVYRIHQGGVSSMRDVLTGNLLMIKYKKNILYFFRGEKQIFVNQFYSEIAKCYNNISLHFFKRKKLMLFSKYFANSIYYNYLGSEDIIESNFKPVIEIIKSKLIRK